MKMIVLHQKEDPKRMSFAFPLYLFGGLGHSETGEPFIALRGKDTALNLGCVHESPEDILAMIQGGDASETPPATKTTHLESDDFSSDGFFLKEDKADGS